MASKTFRFPLDTTKCVIQSFSKNEESQYEAFQSILASIMSANSPPITEADKQSQMTSYEFLCFKNNIALYAGSLCPKGYNGIIFDDSEITHYKSCKNGKVKNPYDLYQANLTQGFCQMFAFFIHIGDESDFVKVGSQTKVITNTQFWRLVSNTYKCGLKTIKLILEDLQVYEKFEADFNNIMNNDKLRVEKGIKPGTTLKTYLEHFRSLTLQDVAYYIFDQQLGGVGYEVQNNVVTEAIYETQLEPTFKPTKLTRIQYNRLLGVPSNLTKTLRGKGNRHLRTRKMTRE
jgi:hypothetical protein